MENEHIAVKSYDVYVIEDSNIQSSNKTYVLADTHKSFPRYDKAEQWIQENGERHLNYTIIEIFKKC